MTMPMTMLMTFRQLAGLRCLDMSHIPEVYCMQVGSGSEGDDSSGADPPALPASLVSSTLMGEGADLQPEAGGAEGNTGATAVEEQAVQVRPHHRHAAVNLLEVTSIIMSQWP